ncbi:hypothetical protein MBLNU230_g2643t1 [Neophaeotheca triangularis]
MTNFETEEASLTTPDGHELFTKTWRASGSPKARLVFIHGFSDYCDTHDPLFPMLAEQGITTYSFDQRGWGRSVRNPKQKGLSGPTSQVMDDITFFIKQLPNDESTPLFLMGHSMGGAQILTYASTGPKEVLGRIRGFLAEAPFIALHPSSRPWRLTVILGRLAGRLLPHQHMVNKLDPSLICRDADVCKAYEEDMLCHDTGTLEGLAGMLDRAGNLEDSRVVLGEGVGEGGKTRLWLGHGTADYICDFEGAKKWFEKTKVEDKELKVYEGWYHKLHNEPGEDKKIFANDVAKWILDRCEDGAVVGGERARL